MLDALFHLISPHLLNKSELADLVMKMMSIYSKTCILCTVPCKASNDPLIYSVSVLNKYSQEMIGHSERTSD